MHFNLRLLHFPFQIEVGRSTSLPSRVGESPALPTPPPAPFSETLNRSVVEELITFF